MRQKYLRFRLTPMTFSPELFRGISRLQNLTNSLLFIPSFMWSVAHAAGAEQHGNNVACTGKHRLQAPRLLVVAFYLQQDGS